jgi:hypothetical protein
MSKECKSENEKSPQWHKTGYEKKVVEFPLNEKL